MILLFAWTKVPTLKEGERHRRHCVWQGTMRKWRFKCGRFYLAVINNQIIRVYPFFIIIAAFRPMCEGRGMSGEGRHKAEPSPPPFIFEMKPHDFFPDIKWVLTSHSQELKNSPLSHVCTDKIKWRIYMSWKYNTGGWQFLFAAEIQIRQKCCLCCVG